MKNLITIFLTIIFFTACNNYVVEIKNPDYDYKYLKFVQSDFDGATTKSDVILVNKSVSNSNARVAECGALFEEYIIANVYTCIYSCLIYLLTIYIIEIALLHFRFFYD